MRDGRPSSTAQYVAVVRAILHAHGAIDDPLARTMLNTTMRVGFALSQLPGLRSRTRTALYAALATRTLFFDAAVTAALADGITQVVTIGAGYDSRAWRFARPGVRFFEVDHPATQADKRRRAPAEGPAFVSVDLSRDEPFAALGRADFDAGTAAQFVIEGVTMYFAEEDVRSLLSALADSAVGGSRLAVNFAAPPNSRPSVLRAVGVARGERHLSFVGAADARSFVAATGWLVDDVIRFRALAPSILGDVALDLDGINPEACAVNAHKDASRGRDDQLPASDGG